MRQEVTKGRQIRFRVVAPERPLGVEQTSRDFAINLGVLLIKPGDLISCCLGSDLDGCNVVFTSGTFTLDWFK